LADPNRLLLLSQAIFREPILQSEWPRAQVPEDIRRELGLPASYSDRHSHKHAEYGRGAP